MPVPKLMITYSAHHSKTNTIGIARKQSTFTFYFWKMALVDCNIYDLILSIFLAFYLRLNINLFST